MALTDNLVAYWKFDESSGNASSEVGGYTLTNTNTVGYEAAKINNGANFGDPNTTKSFRRTADTLGIGSNNAAVWSANMWVKPAAIAAGERYTLLGIIASGQKQTSYFYQNTAGVYKFGWTGYEGSTGQDLFIDLAGALSTTEYSMITIYKNGTSVTFYVNGSLVGSLTITQNDGDPGRGPEFAIGMSVRFADNGGYFEGLIDEYGIWSRELTAGEKTSLYNSGNGFAYPFAVGPANIKTRNGIAKANIKTRNGIAIASIKSINGIL